jgi:hypothetical protein
LLVTVVITGSAVVAAIIGGCYTCYNGGRPLRFLSGAIFSAALLRIPSSRSPPYLFLKKSAL